MLANLEKELASTNILSFDVKPAWAKKHWLYDFRTNVYKTRIQNHLALSDFDEFIECYKPEDRTKRRESRQLLLHCSNSSRPCVKKKIDRWKSYTYDELIARDKTDLDIALLSAIHGLHSVSPSMEVIWLKDESLEYTDRSCASMRPRHSCVHAHQNLPPAQVLAQEIVEQLEATLEEFRFFSVFLLELFLQEVKMVKGTQNDTHL